MNEINRLLTEQNNPATAGLSRLDTLQMLERINDEDRKVADAVRTALPQIAAAVDGISARIARGGRIFYVGAGTSGRLALADASECPCTYGTPPELVQAVVAGGLEGIADAASGNEDSPADGERDLSSCGLTADDCAVGITASGRTPYVLGAMRYAAGVGALTVGITNNPETALQKETAVCIAAVTGPEVVEGSTRMKAGTAQKMVLNMLSTAVMVKSGRVFGNRMVAMSAYNEKLKIRAVRMVCDTVGCGEDEAAQLLAECGYDVKTAIAARLLGCDAVTAGEKLAAADGRLDRLIGGERK